MRKSFLAIPLFSLGLMATSALALDIGAGKGGVDVDLNVGGKDGSAIGVDVQVGGGGVSVGADVNAGGAGGGKSGGGTGSAGGSGGQAGAGSGANANGVSSPSSSGAAAPANSSSAVSPATASAVDAPRVVQLPLYLLPTRDSGPDHTPPGSGAQVESTGSVRLDPMVSRPGIPASVLGACREAIASAASPMVLPASRS